MPQQTCRTYHHTDMNKLSEFLNRYREKYPDARLASAGFYTNHHGLEDGANIFIVLDARQQIIGFAPVFLGVLSKDKGNVVRASDVWTIILADPDIENPDEVRDLLFLSILARVNDLMSEFHIPQVRLTSDLMDTQKGEIDYLLQQGFESFERIYVMRRDPSQPIPAISTPSAITFRQSKLAAQAEQETYLELFNTCFPETPRNFQDLQFLLQSPLWTRGTAIHAYSPSNQMIGSVLTYWDESRATAVTDDVMVAPGWRGQNIAQALIEQGLRYCLAQGMSQVCLEVKATNSPAVSVYRALGYQIINSETLFGKWLRLAN